jgi:hypothetical protein
VASERIPAKLGCSGLRNGDKLVIVGWVKDYGTRDVLLVADNGCVSLLVVTCLARDVAQPRRSSPIRSFLERIYNLPYELFDAEHYSQLCPYYRYPRHDRHSLNLLVHYRSFYMDGTIVENSGTV